MGWVLAYCDRTEQRKFSANASGMQVMLLPGHTFCLLASGHACRLRSTLTSTARKNPNDSGLSVHALLCTVFPVW